jgi:hypothetical protein
MAFSKLVRYEHGGKSCYGDLLEHTENGFLVKELSGNLADGLKATVTEPVQVQTVRKAQALGYWWFR